MKRFAVVMVTFVALSSSASADGLGTKWRAYRVGSQIGTLENAIKSHQRSVELNRSTGGDVRSLKKASSSLASTLRSIREAKETLSADHQTRLQALQMPTIFHRMEVSTNLWGSTGFAPSEVSAVEALSAMGEQYSALFKVADSMGVKMKSMKVTLSLPRGTRINYQNELPGVDLKLDR